MPHRRALRGGQRETGPTVGRGREESHARRLGPRTVLRRHQRHGQRRFAPALLRRLPDPGDLAVRVADDDIEKAVAVYIDQPHAVVRARGRAQRRAGEEIRRETIENFPAVEKPHAPSVGAVGVIHQCGGVLRQAVAVRMEADRVKALLCHHEIQRALPILHDTRAAGLVGVHAVGIARDNRRQFPEEAVDDVGIRVVADRVHELLRERNARDKAAEPFAACRIEHPVAWQRLVRGGEDHEDAAIHCEELPGGGPTRKDLRVESRRSRVARVAARHPPRHGRTTGGNLETRDAVEEIANTPF